MKQEKIKTLIAEMMTRIILLGAQVGDEFKTETIHDFRIESKKLRSFLRLLRLHANDDRPKMSKEFKRLYQIAGAIRDAQLELEQLGGNLVSLPEYIRKLEQSLAQRKKEWKKRYHKKIAQKMADKLSAIPYEPLHPAVLENFLAAKMISINKLSDILAPTDDQVHLIRKEVKDILYTAKLTKKKWNANPKDLKIVSAKKLAELATVIGNYNDQRVSLQHIHSFSSPEMSKDEAKTIKKIHNKEKENLDTEKKNILSFVKNLMSAGQDSTHK